MILEPQRTLLAIFRKLNMKERVVVKRLTHWKFDTYLKVGHTNSGEAMTMGRMTYVVLSMALLMKTQEGKQGIERYKQTHMSLPVPQVVIPQE